MGFTVNHQRNMTLKRLAARLPLETQALTLSLPSVAKGKISTNVPHFHFTFIFFEKQMASCESKGREFSFEWSHHRISSIESKVKVTLQNPIKQCGSERVKKGF